MPTRRSNFLSLSAGRGGTAGVVVVVAETVAVVMELGLDGTQSDDLDDLEDDGVERR